MPELPDLEYIVSQLAPRLAGKRITEVAVREPVVIRMLLAGAGGFAEALPGRSLVELHRHGPFLHFTLSGSGTGPRGGGDAGDRQDRGAEAALVIHCMLAGRLQLAAAGEKPIAHLCFSLALDSGETLRYGDDKKMGKVYLAPLGAYDGIPGFLNQGVDIISEEFTRERFEKAIKGRRNQVRVFLMDQTALSALGNAYADEILFDARIHPKTFCSSLGPRERDRLYESIRSVVTWGIDEVRKAGQPVDVKVRDHMRVRGRRDEPCPVCGTKIRRAGVLGYDAFFCPSCQPATRKQQIPWQGAR